MKTIRVQFTNNHIYASLKFIVVLSLLLVIGGLSQAAMAQDHAASVKGQEMNAPQTAQEHRERAAQYRKLAVERRQEAASHKKMLADFSKGVAKPPKNTSENPYVKNMRTHCEKYARAAEALAVEAEEMARYHELRAKEKEGQ